MGHQVCIACGAEEAMPMIRNLHPHIVISDIEMPGLSGYDLARWIRQEMLADVPFVVALTGYSRASDRIASLEAGFDEHLVKPVSIKTLHQLLGKLQARLTDVPPERSA